MVVPYGTELHDLITKQLLYVFMDKQLSLYLQVELQYDAHLSILVLPSIQRIDATLHDSAEHATAEKINTLLLLTVFFVPVFQNEQDVRKTVNYGICTCVFVGRWSVLVWFRVPFSSAPT